MIDIFEFWSRIKRGEHVHPADREVFGRINAKRHGFRLDCLPTAFRGRLRDAPVVLLYLSPGFRESDVGHAETEGGKDYYFQVWQGREALWDPEIPGSDWFSSRTKVFGNYEKVANKIALLNIGAYHSVGVKDHASLLALPSSRVSLEWAQTVLFPDAESGKRTVLCMRSPAYWGLEEGRQYGTDLFAPPTTMGGHLIKGRNRSRLVELVKARLNDEYH
jgi:hypothetical protein